jgi:peptidoglycan/xylan/chitin deacetylase (PgdA/CDA1 family)
LNQKFSLLNNLLQTILMNVKLVLRNSIAKALFLSGISSPKLRGQGRLSIATFHRVLPEAERQDYPFPGLVVTPEELDKLLTYFTEYYDCGDLETQHKRYLSGETTALPLLAITFDDAQFDNYKYARPVLARHHIKASFFVPVIAVEQQKPLWHDQLGFAILNMLRQGHSGQNRLLSILSEAGLSMKGSDNLINRVVSASKGISLESRLRLVASLVDASGTEQIPDFARLMTFDEIGVLATDGHEIGSHSMTHCLMPECDDKALEYEVAESRRVLQARLGKSIYTFCYPNGNSDSRSALAVSQAGYLRAVTTDWGSNSQKMDRFRLRRYDMDTKQVQDSTGNFLPALLAFRMSGLYPGLGQ